MTDSEIKALIKKYPVQKNLDQNYMVHEHQRQVKRDTGHLRQVLEKTDTEMKDCQRFFKDYAAKKICNQIQYEDNERTMKLVQEMATCEHRLMKPLFIYKLNDELDYISHCKDATQEYLSQRYNHQVKPSKIGKNKLQVKASHLIWWIFHIKN